MLAQTDPLRLTLRVFRHWNYCDIKERIEAVNKGRQLHGRHLHTFRWEYYMYKHLGPRWFENVFDRDEWKVTVEKVKNIVAEPFRLL